MATTAQKLKLGIFLFVGVLLVVAMFMLFTSVRLWEHPDRYYLRAPNSIYGLEMGSAVHVRGVRVGSVASLKLFADDFESVTVTLEIDSGIRINADAKAFLRLHGLTGLRVVDIYGGTGEVGALEPGSYIPYGETTLDRLQDVAEDLAVQVSQVMVSTNRLVDNLATLTAQIDWRKIDGILDETMGLMTRLERAGVQLEALLDDSRQPLQRSLVRAGDAFSGVERMTTDIEGVLANLDAVVTDVRGLVRVNADEFRITMTNLREASQNLRQLSLEVRRQPSRFLFGGAPEERRPP